MNAGVLLVNGVILPVTEVLSVEVVLVSVSKTNEAEIAKRSTIKGNVNPRRKGFTVGRGRIAGAAIQAQGIRLVPEKVIVIQVADVVDTDVAVVIHLPMIRGMTRNVRRNVLRRSVVAVQVIAEGREVGLPEAEVDQRVESESSFRQ